MTRNYLILLLAAFCLLSCSNESSEDNILPSDSINISETTLTFFDISRDRSIETKIYYPSQQQGIDAPIIGKSPLIVFGHGFLMPYEAYESYWTRLVPQGYILCFPTTESDFSADHGQFTLDLAFVAEQMHSASNTEGSIFHNAIQNTTALLGHSMGGGAALLAAESTNLITTVVNFAAAETTPSAITSCSNISIPSLLFSGSSDCVAPQAEHQDIMYNALESSCKTQISIIDGGHCNFADTNFNCTLGESLCGGSTVIERALQLDITLSYLEYWLDYTLKNDSDAFNNFSDSLISDAQITYNQFCN